MLGRCTHLPERAAESLIPRDFRTIRHDEARQKNLRNNLLFCMIQRPECISWGEGTPSVRVKKTLEKRTSFANPFITNSRGSTTPRDKSENTHHLVWRLPKTSSTRHNLMVEKVLRLPHSILFLVLRSANRGISKQEAYAWISICCHN